MLRVTSKTDTSKMVKSIRQMANASHAARRQAIKIIAGEVVLGVVRDSPRDTNRFVRGWIEAGNKAGVTSLAVPSLNQSSRHDQIAARLQRQLAKWQGIVQRYERQGRRDKHYNQAVRRRDAAKRELERFWATEDGAVVAFDLYKWQRNYSGRKLTTVRHNIQGGEGQIITAGDHTFVHLHNKEPHASVVERRTGVMRIAMAKYKAVGLRRATKGYIARVAAAGGVPVK